MTLDQDGDEQTGTVFRGRKLTADTDVYSFNTWDDVDWTPERQHAVTATISAQLQAALANHHNTHDDHDDKQRVDTVMREAGERWDWFYKHHSRWFFKDRQWLPSEFPELFAESVEAVWEVGCGAGNTLFPLFKHHKSVHQRRVTVHACDVSQEAVRLVRSFRDFDPVHMNVFVYDANQATLPMGIPPGTLDAITCVFVLSALNPANLPALFKLFHGLLKPGGVVLVRDYAWGDLAQTRLKPDRVVAADGSLYTRGDGTAVHFFKDGELAHLANHEQHLFAVTQDYTDRRLIVNRKRKLEMFRSWTQVKLKKL